jgi:LCP family protein required for cell wall assembly
MPWTPTGTYQPQPTANPASETPTPAPPTQTEPPTIDPNMLVNTIAPLSTFEATGSQVLNNGQETVNFLLIGSDRRPGGSFRTDTMVIAILRPNEGQAALISIPRDLWVYIPGWENQRINTAYQHGESVGYPGGGAGLLKETILYNLGIRIDHTAMVEFDGFRQIIDTLGGVDIPVSCAYTDWRLIDPSYDPQDEDNWYLHTAGPGLIHMDGDLALWYARSRQKSSDFDRGRRQQEVLRALFSQALQAGTLTRIPDLYNNLKETVQTDLGLVDILQLSVYAPRMSVADIRSYYIRPPYVSSWITEGGAYVLLPNENALQGMLSEALSPATTPVEKQAVIIDVMNGTSVEGYDALAATRLSYAGYETNLIPSDRQDYAYSVLIDKTAAQDRSASEPILNVMGLQPGSLISSPDPASKAHYLLILGYDYQPCFKPENLGQ